METAIIRKASGDYIDTKSGKLSSGKFWEIQVDGIQIRKRGTLSKKEIVEHVKQNFGFDTEIFMRVA